MDDEKDIFRKPDIEAVEEEDETEESEEDENEEEDDDDEEEPQKIKPWDVLMDITIDKMQGTLTETVEKALQENPGKDLPEAEEIACDELKTKYLSEFVSSYKYLTDLSAALRKDPVNKKMQETAKRLRDEEDNDEDESSLYVIKKRKFLIEKKLNDYDPPSYKVAEEQILSLPHKHTCMNSIEYFKMRKRGMVLILCFIMHSQLAGQIKLLK